MKSRRIRQFNSKLRKTPCAGISHDTLTERAVCAAALAVGKELLAQRAVLLSTVYHDFTNNVERSTDTGITVHMPVHPGYFLSTLVTSCCHTQAPAPYELHLQVLKNRYTAIQKGSDDLLHALTFALGTMNHRCRKILKVGGAKDMIARKHF